MNPPRLTATHTHQFPGWAFIMAWCTPDVIHCTCTQWAAYDTCISPPLHISPPLEHSFSLHTTTSDTSSKFTTYNWIKMTTPSKDGFAVFKQDGNKCPILHHSKLSTKIFHDFITGCRNYITNRKSLLTNRQSKSWLHWKVTSGRTGSPFIMMNSKLSPSPTSSSALRMPSCLPNGKPMLRFSFTCTIRQPHYSSFLSQWTIPITTDY